MICYQCDWCGRVEPAGAVHQDPLAFNPVVEPPQDWQTFRASFPLHVYTPHHFCTVDCAGRWEKHRQWRKAKKRPRAKAV